MADGTEPAGAFVPAGACDDEAIGQRGWVGCNKRALVEHGDHRQGAAARSDCRVAVEPGLVNGDGTGKSGSVFVYEVVIEGFDRVIADKLQQAATGNTIGDRT